MKATGEVMAIERTIEACLNKAVRGLEMGRADTLLWEDPAWASDDEAIWWRIDHAHDERLWAIMAALRRGAEPAEIAPSVAHRHLLHRQDGRHPRPWSAACSTNR